MKKLLLSVLLVGAATLANAQKSEIAEAKKNWELFANNIAGNTLDKKLAVLEKGLKSTDLATTNEKSKALAEGWTYRALISSAIAASDTVNQANADAKVKIAQEAIEKSTSLDTKGTEKANLEIAKTNIRNAVNGKGVRAYRNKDYETAYTEFKSLLALNPTDTAMYINVGVMAKMLKKYPEAVENFRKVISFNVPETKGFYAETIDMALREMKDTTLTLALTKEALAKYPDDPSFVTTETDIFIARGDIAKTQELVTKLIAKDPSKAVYHHILGDTYFKQAFALQKDREKIDQKKVKEFEAITAKMVALLDQAIPHYKKAVEVDPKYAAALETLSRIYAFKGDTKSYEEYNNKFKAIQGN